MLSCLHRWIFRCGSHFSSADITAGLSWGYGIHGICWSYLWSCVWITYDCVDISKLGIVFELLTSPNWQFWTGYLNRIAQLITIPPYVTTCVLAIIIAHFSDKVKHRGSFIFWSLALSGVGFIMAITTPDRPNMVGVTYAQCFLACCGFFPALPGCGCISWLANNVAGPHTKEQ